ncbi:MAG: DUF4403 family protein [Gemmatimonadota bacterium]
MDRGARTRRRLTLVGAAGALLILGIAAFLLFLRTPSLTPPPPTWEGDEAALPDLPTSSILLPILMDPGVLEARVEAELPSRFGNLEERRQDPSIPGLEFAFEAERESTALSFRGDTVALEMVLRYRGRVWYDAPFLGPLTAACPGGEASAPRVRVVLSSPVGLSEDWALRTETTVETLEAASPEVGDRCMIPGLELDVTDALLAGAFPLLQEQAGLVDDALSRVALREEVERAWEELRQPILMADETWLTLEPVGVWRAELEGTDGEGMLRASVGLALLPRVVMGAEPPASDTRLPPRIDDPDGEEFELVVDGRIGYALASRLATEAMAGQEFTVGGRTVEVQGVEVSGHGGGRLALALEVEGAVQGRLFLVGTPVYDSGTGSISIPDLSLHVESRNVLARSAGWLLEAGFSDEIRRRAVWPITPLVAQSRTAWQEAWNRELAPGVQLEGGLDELEVIDVGAGRGEIVVRSRLEGSARILIDPRPTGA